MSKIGLFYGSDTGNTESVAQRLIDVLGKENFDLIEVTNASADQVSSYEKIILATSTWGDGDLQSDWEDFVDTLDDVDFSSKTVALIGLGDAEGYEDTFCNALSLLHDKVKDATLVGQTSTDGYEYEDTTAVVDGKFLGLAIDEENQDDLTNERIENWAEQIKGDLGL